MIAIFLIFLGILPAQANPKYASIVIDADTGRIVSARYADKVLHPASLTKIMTLLLVFEAVERGELNLRSRISISRHAAGMVPSKLNLPVGSSIRVKDAIKALVTKSANDIAVALGEAVAGTESNFAYQMTQKARQIGMRNTRFKNASGLHHRSQISTARDMAKLARYIIKKYPEYYEYFSTQRFTYRGKTYTNHNRLMKTFDGMDGMKTGYINASGFNLVASAVRNNKRLIGVVFGGKTSRSRNNHMAGLMSAAFGKMRTVRIANHKPAPAPTHKPAPEVIFASMQPQAQQLLKTTMRGMANGFLGQGDIDPNIASRYATGLIAAAVHTGDTKQMRGVGRFNPDNFEQKKSFYGANSLITKNLSNSWSVQIGAFFSRLASDQALQKAEHNLPASQFKNAQPRITVAKTKDHKTLYRARFAGLSEAEAKRACSILRNCIIVAP